MLTSDFQKGAYEWLVSVCEVERVRPSLADRVLDVSYDDLTARPADAMKNMAGFLGLAMDRRWVERAFAAVGSPSTRSLPPFALPPGMAEAFNDHQAALGFPTRAQAQIHETLVSHEDSADSQLLPRARRGRHGWPPKPNCWAADGNSMTAALNGEGSIPAAVSDGSGSFLHRRMNLRADTESHHTRGRACRGIDYRPVAMRTT